MVSHEIDASRAAPQPEAWNTPAWPL